MRALPIDRPFTRSEANADGVSDPVLHRAVRSERLERVRRGVYGDTGSRDDARVRARAASLAYTAIPLSHLSSALVRGWPIVGATPAQPEMTVPPRGPGNVRGVHAYRARVREHDLDEVGGRLCLSPARTVIDIARHYNTVTAVCILDHVLNKGVVSPEELRDVIDFCRRWPGAPKALKALRRCDSRSESPLESVSRLVLGTLGLPAPELQTSIVDENGVFLGRTDFYWDEFGVAGEADGHSKYDDRTVLVKEKCRESALTDTELKLVRWDWAQAWWSRSLLDVTVRRAFRRGVARDANGTPRRWSVQYCDRLAV